MANTLTREQLLQTYQGLQSLIKGVPLAAISLTEVETLSDESLLARIDAQQIAIDNNAAVGVTRRPTVALDGPIDIIEEYDTPAPTGARDVAISKLKAAIANPAEADMGYIHALLGSYSESQTLTIPDLAFDDQLTESELAAAQEITTRLEAGESAPQIESAFAQSAATIEEAQRQAALEEAQRAAQEAAALRQQNNLELSVDAHLAAMGYITPEQVGTLEDSQRANAFTAFMRTHGEILTTPGTASAEIGTLSVQQAAALNAAAGYAVTPQALTLLTAGRAGEQRGEDLEQWMESGDPRQVMMAQATLGLPVTGDIDEATAEAAASYIRQPYPESLSEVAFLQNATGGLNPTSVFDAANSGQIYVPTLDELRAAGMDEATLASIAAAKPAAEILDAREALGNKEFDAFTTEDWAVWTSDTQEELIALHVMEDPALYASIIQARNTVAANATLEVTLAIDTAAPAVDLAEVDLNNPPADMIIPASLSDRVEGDEPLTVLEERVVAANPLDLNAPDPTVLGGSSEAAGTFYNNAAVAKTADGTLVFDGPDVSLNMVVEQLKPTDDNAMTMEDALRGVQALQTTNQELFLAGASPSGSDDLRFIGGRLSMELGYEPDHQFNFNNPLEMEALLTGVYAYNNNGLIPDASGNMLQSFVNSQDVSVVAMRESITRVAEGNPLLTSAPVMIAEEGGATRGIVIDNTATGSIPGNQSLWENTGAEADEGPNMSEAPDELFNPDGSFRGTFGSTDLSQMDMTQFNFGDAFVGAVDGAAPATETNPDLQSTLEALAARKAGALNLDGGPQ